MGQAKNIWISDRDKDLWAWVERYAHERRMSVSAVIMTALEQFRGEQDGPS